MLFTPDDEETRKIMQLFADKNNQRTGQSLAVETQSIRKELL